MTSNNPAEIINAEIFEKLFREYFYALTGFANHIISDPDSSKDVVHSVFINLWENREKMHLETSLKSWLYTSVKNRCLNHLRDHKKFIYNVSDTGKLLDDQTVINEDIVVQAEFEGRVKIALDNLPDACRRIFLLSRFEGLKYRQIAEKLKISQKTVETQMSRALKSLREDLKDYIITAILIISMILKIK